MSSLELKFKASRDVKPPIPPTSGNVKYRQFTIFDEIQEVEKFISEDIDFAFGQKIKIFNNLQHFVEILGKEVRTLIAKGQQTVIIFKIYNQSKLKYITISNGGTYGF